MKINLSSVATYNWGWRSRLGNAIRDRLIQWLRSLRRVELKSGWLLRIISFQVADSFDRKRAFNYIKNHYSNTIIFKKNDTIRAMELKV